MTFGQLASVASLFAQFHAGTRKLLQNFCLCLLEQQTQFVLISLINDDLGGGGGGGLKPLLNEQHFYSHMQHNTSFLRCNHSKTIMLYL